MGYIAAITLIMGAVGYVYTSNSIRHKFKLSREHSIHKNIIFFIYGFFIVIIGAYAYSEILEYFGNWTLPIISSISRIRISQNFSTTESINDILFLTTISLILARTAALIENKLIERTQSKIDIHYEKAIKDNEIEKIAFKSLKTDPQREVMLTLKSRKVYVGRIIRSTNPTNPTELLILPSSSGYSDDETLEITITTDYNEVYEKIKGEILNEVDIHPFNNGEPGEGIINEEKLDEIIEYNEKELQSKIKTEIDDFAIAIPISEILTIRIFNNNHARKFMRKKANQPRRFAPK